MFFFCKKTIKDLFLNPFLQHWFPSLHGFCRPITQLRTKFQRNRPIQGSVTAI